MTEVILEKINISSVGTICLAYKCSHCNRKHLHGGGHIRNFDFNKLNGRYFFGSRLSHCTQVPQTIELWYDESKTNVLVPRPLNDR